MLPSNLTRFQTIWLGGTTSFCVLESRPNSLKTDDQFINWSSLQSIFQHIYMYVVQQFSITPYLIRIQPCRPARATIGDRVWDNSVWQILYHGYQQTVTLLTLPRSNLAPSQNVQLLVTTCMSSVLVMHTLLSTCVCHLPTDKVMGYIIYFY